jgi:hypothetical protein
VHNGCEAHLLLTSVHGFAKATLYSKLLSSFGRLRVKRRKEGREGGREERRKRRIIAIIFYVGK